jgi:glyoxylase-like metal-dependent hydrolase (beta-lactamase superfamily II)
MQEITPHVYVETAYPPYNVGLVKLGNVNIVVDVPPRPEHARRWLRETQEVAGAIRYVVLTDSQPDRILGVMQWQVPIIASETTARRIAALMEEEKEWEEYLEGMQERYAEEAEDLALLEPRPVTLAPTARLRLYRHEPALVLEPSAGAAPGSLWLFVPEDQVLFAGDSVVVNEPPVLDQTPDLGAWLQALAHLEERREVQRIIPGRGKASIYRAETEAQQEFMRVVAETARELAGRQTPGEGLAKATNELQQAFFNSLSKKSEAARRLRNGLEAIVESLRAPEEEEGAEEE